MFPSLQQLPWPSQPSVFFPALLVFVSAYYLISPFYSISKQKAWILTAISSFSMTLFSLPFVLDYVMGGMSVHAVRHTSLSPLSSWINSIFQAYLVAWVCLFTLVSVAFISISKFALSILIISQSFSDLIIGALHYREHVNVLSGWVHHSLYIFVNELALRRSWAHIFAFCSIMEVRGSETKSNSTT